MVICKHFILQDNKLTKRSFASAGFIPIPTKALFSSYKNDRNNNNILLFVLREV